jgi:hypothetical protein
MSFQEKNHLILKFLHLEKRRTHNNIYKKIIKSKLARRNYIKAKQSNQTNLFLLIHQKNRLKKAPEINLDHQTMLNKFQMYSKNFNKVM